MSSISITIKSSGDAKYEVSIDSSKTILDLKNEISAKADVPAERQRLIYSGKVLKDHESIATYKIQSGHTVHLVKSAAKAGSAGPSAGTTTGASNGASTATDSANGGSNNTSSAGIPSNISAGQGAFNPLADLTGARYAGYTQLPSASMFGPDGGMNQSMPDPEQLSQMMSNPMFQESMNSLLSNPQMLDYMIEQSPQLRAMGPQARQMLQSPFFRQMMSNPEMMRGMMDMGRGGGFGGAGGAGGAFPAPGGNPTTEGPDSEGSGTSGPGSQGPGSQGPGSGSQAPPNPFAQMFGGGDPMSMFGGGGSPFGGGAPFGGAPAQEDSRPPEERYETQLRQLNDMGFFDFDTNVSALRRSGGNVQGALEFLLSE